MRFRLVVMMCVFLAGTGHGQYILTQPDAYGFYTNYSAEPLAFEDINNNGSLDMTLGGNFTDFGPFPNVSVNFNRGGGSFGNWQTVSSGSGLGLVKEMEYGFLRVTTERDLVVTFNDRTEVLWNVNNTLSVQQTNLPAGTFLSLGRVNNDINDDLALVTGTQVKVFLNTGSGTFNTTSIQTISEQPDFMRVVDLDNTESFFDLITWVSSTVKIRKNTGGTFGNPTNISVGSNVITLEVGDVNYDDYPDLLVVNSNGTLKIHLNDGRATSTPPPTRPSAAMSSTSILQTSPWAT